LMLMGEFREGARIYEGRVKSQMDLVGRDYPQPAWNGAKFKNRTLFLHSEQGLGDTLNFLRYVPLVKARGGRVILECQAPLLPLCAGLGADRVIAAGETPPPFDLCRSLVSLPFVFGHDLKSLPAKVPYLVTPADRVEAWRARLGAPQPGRLRIGLVWAGSPGHGNDRHRSVSIDSLRPILDVPGATFFSLQKGPAADQLRQAGLSGTVHDLGASLRDFADTAAVVELLDLVISVDTSVVHLAGALARPCWAMLPFCPDWRWLIGREDSPWYPTLRLFRQTTSGDWAGVVDRMARELAAKAAAGAVVTAG
ncbi:MAG: hypothetical protein HQL39_05880, partial [Alphaproteobacteria bacterium]|nr:hypothetical protein [Alphaproteobacteria bacterium]